MQSSLITCSHDKLAFDQDRGESICYECGEVIEQKMNDERPELVHEDSIDNRRTGPATTLVIHDKGLSTIISKTNYDAAGKIFSHAMQPTIRRMRLWDSRSKTRTSSDQNLRIALNEIGKLKEKMGLSESIIERASILYRKASDANLIRGRSIKSVVGACMYAACRDLDTHRTIIDISEHLQERRKRVAKAYRILFRELDLSTPMADPIRSIIKFANNLKIPEPAKREAVLVFDILSQKEIVAGKKPDAVSAAAIYMACIRKNVDISQQAISRVSGVSSVTIRNRVREFSKYVKLL